MPEISQVHASMALTNISVAYKNPAFIADTLAPPVPVRKQQDKYFIVDSDRESFRSTPDHRAPGAAANEVDFALSTDSYYCNDHALTSIVPDEERANADPAIQPDIDRVEFLSEKIGLNKEIELAGLIQNTATLPGRTLSGVQMWSDTNSAPISDIEAARADIIEACQSVPNTLVLPYDVFVKLRTHPAILSNLQYTHSGVPTTDILAQIFDVERVLVPRAVQNTARPGQSASMAYVWGKHAFLAYIPPRAGLKTLAFALTFSWNNAPGSIHGRSVETWRDDTRKGAMIRVQRYYDQKIVCKDAIYVWKNAVA